MVCSVSEKQNYVDKRLLLDSEGVWLTWMQWGSEASIWACTSSSWGLKTHPCLAYWGAAVLLCCASAVLWRWVAPFIHRKLEYPVFWLNFLPWCQRVSCVLDNTAVQTDPEKPSRFFPWVVQGALPWQGLAGKRWSWIWFMQRNLPEVKVTNVSQWNRKSFLWAWI